MISWSSKKVRRMGDGLRVVSRKHSKLRVRDHNIMSTILRKVRMIFPPWIVVRGEWVIHGSLVGDTYLLMYSG